MSQSNLSPILDILAEDDILVLTIMQPSIFDQHTRALKLAFQETLRDTPKLPVAVSMEHVKFISSEGIGALLSLNRLAREQQRAVRLCHISQQVGEMLTLVRLVDDSSSTDRGLMSTSKTVEEARVHLRQANG